MKRAVPQHADWVQYMAGMAESTQQEALVHFYRGSWPSAETPLEDIEFVALDLETTGLNPRVHAIVSIGVIPFTLARIRSNQAWHPLIRPPGDLLPESVAFHHITHSDISQAPRFAEVAKELLEHLRGKVAVVHYHPIERGFLDQAFRQSWGEGLRFPMVDTMNIEARLHPRRKPGWLARVMGKKPLSIRLADSRSRYGLPAYQAHHALTDALATAELLQAQVATHYSAEQPISSLWI